MRFIPLVLVVGLAACSSPPVEYVANPDSRQDATPDTAHFSILSINDVYRIDGLSSSEAGGLDRVRSVRAAVENDHPNLLFLHGGDFLYPSFMSRVFDGKQMIDIMNMLDGDDGSFDKHLFVVPGNHEFDNGSEDDVFLFQELVNESQFTWLAANVTFDPVLGTKVDSDNIAAKTIVDFGDISVGLFGLTIAVDGVDYATFDASQSALEEYTIDLTGELRREGADFVVALTHLDADVDESLLRLDGGPDLIIGGHEHEALVREHDGRFVLKADADAITARIVHVALLADGSEPVVRHDLITVDKEMGSSPYEQVEPDETVGERIAWWRHRTSFRFCDDIGLAMDCLEDILAFAGTRIVAEELSIRGRETNLGNFVTDLMAAAGQTHGDIPDDAPVVAFINSGSLRLNQNISQGSLVNRQHIEELIQYDGPLFLIKLSPQELHEALEHSAACRISGPWLQVSGLSYTAHPNTGSATNVSVAGKPLTETGEIYAVTVQFVADPDFFGNQDGYTFDHENIIGILTDENDDQIMLKDLIYRGIDNLEVRDDYKYLAPEVEGRIELEMEPGTKPVCET